MADKAAPQTWALPAAQADQGILLGFPQQIRMAAQGDGRGDMGMGEHGELLPSAWGAAMPALADTDLLEDCAIDLVGVSSQGQA